MAERSFDMFVSRWLLFDDKPFVKTFNKLYVVAIVNGHTVFIKKNWRLKQITYNKDQKVNEQQKFWYLLRPRSLNDQ